MAIYEVNDSTKYLLDLYEKYIPSKLEDGMYNRQDLEDFYEVFGVSGRINLMVKVLNDLEIFDELLAPITVVSDQPTQIEMWADGDWGETASTVRAEGSEINKRHLTIKAKNYAHQVNVDKNELLRAMNAMRKSANRFLSPFAGIDAAIITAVKGYKTLLRKLALTALFYNPKTNQDPTLPVLYRDTTGFTAENQVIPPRNGFLTFETGASQEHHIATATLTEDFLLGMRDKIVDKGGDAGSIAIWANEKTWRKFMALFTNDDLERLKFIRDLGAEGLEQSPITTTYNIVLPNSDMPDDYWVAIDMSKKVLQKRISDDPQMQGVNVAFNTIGQIATMNPTADVEALRLLSNDALKMANNIQGGIKLELNQVGFGVIACGSAVVGYSAGATYTEPNWFA